MSHRKEQGSVIGYVLVGVLLTALVVGGIYIVRNQLVKPSNTTAQTEVASTPSDTETANPDTKKSHDDALKAALEKQAAEEKKAQEQKAASEATEQKSQPPQSAPTTDKTSATRTLPSTGPADGLISLTGAMLMAGTSVAYMRSRKLI